MRPFDLVGERAGEYSGEGRTDNGNTDFLSFWIGANFAATGLALEGLGSNV
jgi:hypothetical protein